MAARDFIEEAQLSGPLHRVGPFAWNDGLNNTCFMEASGGVEEVTGTAALQTRIREVYAPARLHEINKGEEFRKGTVRSAEAKVESVGNVIRDPFGTIKNVPKGASHFFGRIGEGLKGGKSVEEGSGLQSATGVTNAKVQLAHQLRVSPYTTNPEL